MKKRLLIISIFVLLLTGCNAKYTLEINNEVIKETFSVIETNQEIIMIKDEFGKTFLDYSKTYGEDINIETNYDALYCEEECSDCTTYVKEFINEDDKVGFKLENEFSFDEYTKSSVATEVIPSFSSSYDGRYLKISGGPNWNYFKDYKDLEKVDITINTSYKVISTNMKKIKDGKYEKSISEDDSRLYITLDTHNTIEIDVDDGNNNTFVKYLIIFVGVLFIALIVCAINNRKKYR